MVRKKRVITPIVLLLGITILNNFGLIRYVENLYSEPLFFRLCLASVFGLIFLLDFLKGEIISQLRTYVFILLLIGYMATSFYVADRFYEAVCENKLCRIPVLTLRQLF